MSDKNENFCLHTCRLIKGKRSFSSGFSDLLDFSALTTKYNTSNSNNEADACAIDSDWQAVGQDMQIALDTYGTQAQTETQALATCSK